MRPCIKGLTPVKLPFLIRSSDALLARWFYEVRRCLQQLRDRIPYSQGGGGGVNGGHGCTPWKPVFTEVSGSNYVTFNLGVVNQVVPGNWDAALAIGPTDTKWVTLTVASSNGEITSVTTSLEAAPPANDTLQQDTPPASFKIVLGVIIDLSPCMIVDENLEASAIEVFRESRNPPSEGEEPFTRWWRWKVNQNTAGEYPYVT